MKKLMICLTLLCSVCLTGCKSNIDKTYEIAPKDVEKANFQEDYMLFYGIQEVYNQNMESAKNDEEKCVIMLKYLDDVYQMASNRYQLDIELLASFQEPYYDYLAACQVYCSTFLEEKNALLKDKQIKDLDYTMAATETGIMLGQIEYCLQQANDFYKK